MLILATGRKETTLRAITPADVPHILRMLDREWRVFMRVSPLEFAAEGEMLPGSLAEDKVGLRGFITIEPLPPNLAFITAAGLRDTWNVKPYFDLLLPEIERAARERNLSKLVFIGNAAWLAKALPKRGFETREWIIVLERTDIDPPPPPPSPAAVRPVHRHDLPALLALDALTFDEIWHKLSHHFSDGLAKGDSMNVAEIAGHIVGYAWLELRRRHAHLIRLAVHPAFQGQGIGAQLLHRAITGALDRRANRITLNTQEKNQRSQALYRRLGFVVTDQRIPVMWKDLKHLPPG